MAKFDPEKHRVVAVPFRQDDPERGQHFHVDLDELASLPMGDGDNPNPFLIKRVENAEARLTELGNRVDGIPHVSEDTLRQLDDGLNAKIQHMVEKHVNSALGDLRRRVVALERKSQAVATASEGEPQSAQLAKLAEAVQSFGKYVATVETDLEERVAAVEQLYAELSENMTENNLKVMKVNVRLFKALKALEYDDEGKAA